MTSTDTRLADALTAPTTRRTHPAEQLGSGKADVDADGVTITGAVVDEPYETRGDFDHVFALFNLDPDAFDVVDNTVRMSTWQQSKRTETGDRDVVQLYAYSFRARKRSAEHIAPAVVEQWRAALIATPRTPPPTAPAGYDGPRGTYPLLIADPQLGKKDTAQAVGNWRDGVTAHIGAARQLGDAVERIHVGFMGDETEGVANNYGNQAHTIELNRSRQLELDYDLRVWTIRAALSLGLPVSASSVISNHGEWTRNGSKEPVTTANDNASTHIARQVATLFDELAPFTGQRVDWTIGEDRPGVVLNLSGVRCYFSHGYVEKGRGPSVEVKTKAAIERQILGRTDELGDVRLYFMAHYHHHYSNEFEGRTLFGCPALEAERSSEYMLDQFGVWSPPGVLGMLVGADLGSRGWGHLNVR
ncbi:MAG TPA: hypothetical protein VFL65_00760 [Jatrophihabitans sp.]|nr:hypothetical protein [Jatrophihabitans sp.]